jgi:hypothetical protein
MTVKIYGTMTDGQPKSLIIENGATSRHPNQSTFQIPIFQLAQLSKLIGQVRELKLNLLMSSKTKPVKSFAKITTTVTINHGALNICREFNKISKAFPNFACNFITLLEI